ncbi:MAG: isoaspartyl peptidase/L-asparaginase [Tepidisphaeraceae bacterium]
MTCLPIILSTWSFGQNANRAGWPLLRSGDAAGAVEAAAVDAELDPANPTVGRSGYPDASGRVTVDAAIMLSPSRHGAVAGVHDVLHPITLARRVMEATPHHLLVGEGAEAFARECGMPATDLSSETSRAAFEKWKRDQRVRLANIEERHHDTIGVLALSANGTLAAACSTSGLAFKRPGRVGDSPIVGAGLYCEPGVGAAVCTGRGELMQGTLAAYVAVDELRRGASPIAAARAVLRRITSTHDLSSDDQAGLIVLRADGDWTAAALLPGFVASVRTDDRDEIVEAICGLK